jgi:hypothetical protein
MQYEEYAKEAARADGLGLTELVYQSLQRRAQR